MDPIVVEGRVVFVRPCGRSVGFIEVMSAAAERRQVVLVREARLTKVIHLGDVVRAECRREEGEDHVVVAEGMPEVVDRWDSRERGQFAPIPSERRTSSSSSSSSSPPCKFWLSTKACPKHQCRFQHLAVGSEEFRRANQERLRAMFEARRDKVFDAGDPWAGKKQGKRSKSQVYADWLVKRYGLGRESVVLDVAGGNGKLAQKLLKVVKRVILVDPRCDIEPLPTGLEHCKSLFHGEFVVGEHVDVVVGLHPDQATDAIVDWAMREGVDFSVVPCCVFAEQFPERRLLSGDRVTTYEELVTFLQEKAPGVAEKDFLPLMGRNIVIYSSKCC